MDRIEMAKAKKAELEEKIEKVRGTPKEEEFQLQIDKLSELIEHLSDKE